MIHQTKDVDIVTKATEQYRHEMHGFYPELWLGVDANIALTDGRNVALFEYELPGVYSGHYFFLDRGREALDVAKGMLKIIFSPTYPVQIIKGYTPLENKGALWMSRKLGFVGHGEIFTTAGPCELFILSKKEYMDG